MQNEARVTDLLTTLGTVGWRKLQETILARFGVSIGHHPLEDFIDRHYGRGRQSSISLHNKALTSSSSSSACDDVLDSARPVYAKLRELFLSTTRALGDFNRLLHKCSIGVPHQAIVQLYIRMQWEIEADNEFTMATGRDTALIIQN